MVNREDLPPDVVRLLRDARSLADAANRLHRLLRRLTDQQVIDEGDWRKAECVAKALEEELQVKHAVLVAWMLLDATLEMVADVVNAQVGAPVLVRAAGEG